MPGILHPPFLSYDDLRRRARDFLHTYHPSGTIPVPIEEIVEFEYEIDIIPVPGLHNAFEVDGFISSNLKALTVDAFVGLSIQKVGEVARPYIADWLAKRFVVSSQVIEKRVDKDRLWPIPT